MKSGVIEYIKNNAYIEELFLDLMNLKNSMIF